jgi:hypothetical protein
MATFFITCAVLGGLVVGFQFVAGLFGVADVDPGDLATPGGGMEAADGVADGLDLLSVRALSSGLLLFGLVGLAAGAAVGPVLALSVALLAGGATTAGVAFLMRMLRRLDHDGVVHIDNAVGGVGIVYLSVPGGRERPGKIHITLQNRLVELQAVADAPLPNGASVLVIDVVDAQTVHVIPSPELVASHD